MISDENTIYEIRYDFNLDGEEIIIPVNCVLKFNGGSLINGTIILNGVKVFPNFNSLVDGNNTLIYTGMPAVGILYWQNGKPTWSNGTNWVDATGQTV